MFHACVYAPSLHHEDVACLSKFVLIHLSVIHNPLCGLAPCHEFWRHHHIERNPHGQLDDVINSFFEKMLG